MEPSLWGIITVLFGGYTVMGGAVAYLFRRVMRAEDGHAQCREDLARMRGEMSRVVSEVDRMAFQSVLDAVIVADDAGVVRQWNPTATGLFGYDMIEALGKPIVSIMADQSAALHNKAFASWLNDKRPPRHGPYEATGRHKDGSEFQVIIILAAWQDNGKTYCTARIRRKLSSGGRDGKDNEP